MQIKNTREFTMLEALEKVLELVPIKDRIGLAIEFSTTEKITKNNLEAIYHMVTQRLAHLAYCLEWSRTTENNGELKPEITSLNTTDYVSATFHDLDSIKPEVVHFLNNSFSYWINNQIVRELSEFLKLYLSELYETCIVLEYAETPLTPRDISDIREECKSFENGGMQERLSYLRKRFDFHITHNSEILSLYKVRNIFSHYDGVVMRKFCNKDGTLTISWPRNTYKFKKRGKREWTPYHKIAKPFYSDIYESVQITWMSQPEIRTYRPLDIIQLSHKDLNDLIFFYLYVFNELHKKLVKIVKDRGLKVKPFERYAVLPDRVRFVSANED